MQAFIVSIFAGCLFPLLPVMSEFGLTNDVADDVLAITALVYIVAVGLVSRHQAVSISSFFFAAACGIIYTADKFEKDHETRLLIKYGFYLASLLVIFYSILYIWERYDRHVTEGTPFLEFDP